MNEQMRRLFRLFTDKTTIDLELLKKWNLAAGIILAAQGLAILLFSGSASRPVYLSFLANDSLQSKLRGTTIAAPAIREVVQVNLVMVIAAMLLVSAVAYLLVGTIWKNKYEAWLAKGWQPLRWVMLVIVAGVVLVTLGLLAGVQVFDSLKSFSLMALLVGIVGLQLELRAATRRGKPELFDWLGLAAALIAGAAPWLIILASMVATNVFGDMRTAGYLWWLFGTTLLGGVLFALSSHLAYLHFGRWKNYRFAELTASVLVVVIETAFTWQLFASVLRP